MERKDSGVQWREWVWTGHIGSEYWERAQKNLGHGALD